MKLRYSLLFLFFLNSVFAAGLELQDTITYTLPSKNKALRSAMDLTPSTVKVMRYKLSEKTKQAIKVKSQRLQPLQQHARRMGLSPAAKQLGMEGLPVLDQGPFGTCVMFSEVAALNAALKKMDFVSPLCALKLGQYAEKNAYEASGWDGSFHRTMLARFEEHGVITMEQQRSMGCGGMTEYPIEKEQLNAQSMSFDEYHQLSYSFKDLGIFWTTLLDVFESEDEDLDTQLVITQIKKSINQGNRVLMGTLLPSLRLGFAGAVGHHHTLNDTWVLSSRIKRNFLILSVEAAHAMVITGYDDNAVAIDNEGKKHVGLLTLRNSWGLEGDQGNFYMSYDYFRVVGTEAIALGALDLNNRS